MGKNASDIGLVIDAMDILHTGRFDGFVPRVVRQRLHRTRQPGARTGDGRDRDRRGEGPESLRNVATASS